MKKFLCIALCLVLLVFTLAACGSKTSEETTETSTTTETATKYDFSSNVNVARASDKAKTSIERPVIGIGRSITTSVTTKGDYTIVVMTKNSTNPYMIGMWDGGTKAGKDLGINVITTAPSTDDSIEEQISIMETYIEQGVDAFIIHPSDSAGIQPAVDKANAAGIPVVAIGTAPGSGAFMRTGVDYYETGYETMKKLCEAAGGKGGVIILEGPAGAQNAEERLAGAKDALAEFPDMKVLASQPANFKRAEAITVMENLLQGEGVQDNLKVVYGANDEMALGAIQVLKASNVKLGTDGVLVGGADCNKDASAAIKAGDMYITYNTDPFGSTYLGVVSLVQLLDNGTIPEEYFIPFPSQRDNPFVTAENVDDYIANYAWFS